MNALARLGLADRALSVMTLAPLLPDAASDVTRTRDGLAAQLAVARIVGRVAAIGDVVYAIVEDERGAGHLKDVAQKAIERSDIDVVVGVGRRSHGPAGLTHSRVEAETCVEVLQRGNHEERIATIR